MNDTMNEEESLMPERDALWAKHKGLTPDLAAEMLAFAGKMEMERNALRKQLDQARSLAGLFADQLGRTVPWEQLTAAATSQPPPRLVVCAAIRRRGTGEIVCGPRHHWCTNTKATLIGKDRWNMFWRSKMDQGFVDQRGEFLTREEAWTIAEREGQLRRRTGTAGTLYSEDLY